MPRLPAIGEPDLAIRIGAIVGPQCKGVALEVQRDVEVDHVVAVVDGLHGSPSAGRRTIQGTQEIVLEEQHDVAGRIGRNRRVHIRFPIPKLFWLAPCACRAALGKQDGVVGMLVIPAIPHDVGVAGRIHGHAGNSCPNNLAQRPAAARRRSTIPRLGAGRNRCRPRRSACRTRPTALPAASTAIAGLNRSPCTPASCSRTGICQLPPAGRYEK